MTNGFLNEVEPCYGAASVSLVFKLKYPYNVLVLMFQYLNLLGDGPCEFRLTSVALE